MININLLPWREGQRKEYEKKTISFCALIGLVAVIVFLLIYYLVGKSIAYQESRNDYLRQQISSLTETIKEIEGLKKKRDDLLSRMQVIHGLQANRTQIVHVFDDLVRQQPKGVYYTKLSRDKGVLNVAGVAQSNALVSALMRNFDESDWFEETALKRVDVIEKRGISNSKFELHMRQQATLGAKLKKAKATQKNKPQSRARQGDKS